MSEHAAVKDEHRKEMEKLMFAGVRDFALAAQLLADFARDERLKEAELATQRAHYLMDVHSRQDCWFCQRIEQLKRGEA